MCGRMRLDTDWSEIVRVFELDPDDIPDFAPRWNIAPTQPVPVIVGASGDRHARWMSWGFVPWFDKSAKPRSRPINAKAETVATSGMFKAAYKSHRCFVPVTGFYEWREEPDGKQPILFHRPDRSLFAVAALWERWRPEGGPAVETFCVLTTPPNAVTGRVHDRMPAVLTDRRDLDRWTAPDADPASLADVVRPAPNEFLVATPVSRAMNSYVNDTAEACAPLASG